MAVFNPLYPIIYLVGGILTPSEKWWSSSVGMIILQTTNQLLLELTNINQLSLIHAL